MKNLYRKILPAVLALALAAALLVLPAAANSAQRYWRGTTATGAVITDGECPIVVEHEALTFNIHAFPVISYSDGDATDYSASVSAAYTFRNPSDMAVTAHLLFPFGTRPDYVRDATSEEKYTVTVDGTPIERTVRHTLNGYGSQFELERDLGRLTDTPREDALLFPDQTVICRTYSVSGVDRSVRSVNIAFDLAKDSGVCVFWPELSGMHTQKDGDRRLSAWASDLETFTIYFIGGDVEPEWKCYEDGGVEDSEVVPGTATLVSTETMSLRTLALSARPADSDVSENDWYNAVIDRMLSDGGRDGVVHDTYRLLDVSDSLMRWYEYDITLEPGQRIVNTVTAPMYPAIDDGYTPAVYSYTYLLSPAATWRSFGTLEININTPYYLLGAAGSTDGKSVKDDSNSTLAPRFVKTDTGYTLSLDGLPEGELEFSLSASATPEAPHFSLRNILPIEILICGGIMLAVAAALVVIIVLIVKSRKRSKNKAAEK